MYRFEHHTYCKLNTGVKRKRIFTLHKRAFALPFRESNCSGYKNNTEQQSLWTAFIRNPAWATYVLLMETLASGVANKNRFQICYGILSPTGAWRNSSLRLSKTQCAAVVYIIPGVAAQVLLEIINSDHSKNATKKAAENKTPQSKDQENAICVGCSSMSQRCLILSPQIILWSSDIKEQSQNDRL